MLIVLLYMITHPCPKFNTTVQLNHSVVMAWLQNDTHIFILVY